MATINVLDSVGATVALEKPLAPGSAADSASRPVTKSVEDKAATGSLTETAPASDTASSGLNGRLQRIAQRLTSFMALLPASLGSKADAASLAVTQSTEDKAVFAATNTKLDTLNTSVTATLGYNSSANFTSGTTAYAAQDVSGGALTFATIGPSAGRIMITSVALRIDSSAFISGQTSYVLHLYDVTPPSAIADSGAWDLGSGDRASYLGSINLGTPIDLGSTLYVGTEAVNKQIKLASTSVYGYLVTVGAYTPTAQVYTVFMHAVAL